MFKSLVVVAVATLTCASVIPSECFNENLTSRTITKREEKPDGWMFNSQPIEIGPTVEASMAPNLQSRMCEYRDNGEEDNLRDFFVTMDDFSDPQMESRNAVQEGIPAQNFIDTIETKNVWNQDKPTNEVPKEYYQEQQPFIFQGYPDLAALISEPSEDELAKLFFLNPENYPENLPNKEVPIIINYEEIQPPKRNPFDDSSVREDSGVLDEALDMIHSEISESEKGDESQGTQEDAQVRDESHGTQEDAQVRDESHDTQEEAQVRDESQGTQEEAQVREEPQGTQEEAQGRDDSQGTQEDAQGAGIPEKGESETEPKQEPQSEVVQKSEEEKLQELRQSLEQLKHMDVQDVQEKIDGYLKELKAETPTENKPTEAKNDKESILS